MTEIDDAEGWPQWRKLVLSTLEKVETAINTLTEKVNSDNARLVILEKSYTKIEELEKRVAELEARLREDRIKIALIVGVVATVGSGIATYIMDKILH